MDTREERKQKLIAVLEQKWYRNTKYVLKKSFKIIWKIKFFLIFAIFMFSVYHIIDYRSDKYGMSKCGKIEDMKQITDYKTNNVTNIIYIRYDQEIEKREVQDNTYYNHKKGDNICFGVIKPEYMKYVVMYFIIAAICVLILVGKIVMQEV